MTPNTLTLRRSGRRTAVAMLCAIAIGPGPALAGMWVSTRAGVQAPVPAGRQLSSAQTVAPTLSADRLDSLVAPIALYPDPLLAQTLAAATYPSEVEELDQWLADHPRLQGEALASAVATQPWTRACNRWLPSLISSTSWMTTSTGRPLSETRSS